MAKSKKKLILESYDKDLKLYESCEVELERLTKKLLPPETFQIHFIKSRLKTRSSLQWKIERKDNNGKYEKISNITDIVWIRIVTYFEDEITLIYQLLSKEFDLDLNETEDKWKWDKDKFGYKSLHCIAKFSKARLALSDYREFSNIKFEIQIRSILQHGWAEIEHDLWYKNKDNITDEQERSFHRLAALLEIADIEFVRLKKSLSENKIKTAEPYKWKNKNLNFSSLKQYIWWNSRINDYNDKLFDIYKFSNPDNPIIWPSDSQIMPFVRRLKEVGINSTWELDNFIDQNEIRLIKRAKELYKWHTYSWLSKAALIFQILSYLEWKK